MIASETCECGYTEVLDADGDPIIFDLADMARHQRHSAHNARALSFDTADPAVAEALRRFADTIQPIVAPS